MNTPNFEKFKSSPFDLKNVFLNNNNDPDDKFFNTNQFSNTNSFTIKDTQ